MKIRSLKNILLLSFFLLSGIKLFACNCGPLEKLDTIREQEFENSDVVFTGTITYLSEGWAEFQIRVTEAFKGDIKRGQLLSGKNNINCEPYIDEAGKWLIYGKMENGILTINQCGLSRSFNNPYNNRYFSSVPMPPLPTANDSASSEAERIKAIVDTGKQYQKNAETELKNEIEMLKKRKSN